MKGAFAIISALLPTGIRGQASVSCPTTHIPANGGSAPPHAAICVSPLPAIPVREQPFRHPQRCDRLPTAKSYLRPSRAGHRRDRMYKTSRKYLYVLSHGNCLPDWAAVTIISSYSIILSGKCTPFHLFYVNFNLIFGLRASFV